MKARILSIAAAVCVSIALVPHTVFAGPSPSITTQPQNQSVLAGTNAVFTVAASGNTPLFYQWTFNSTNLANSTHFSGATNATLTVSNVVVGDAGNYQCTVTNTHGSATSSNATLTVLVPATIIAQPTNQSVVLSNNASFTATVTGSVPLHFQWYFNGALLTDGGRVSGSGTTNLNIANVQTNGGGSYQLVVTNNYGSATSAVVSLTVLVPATIIMQPTNQSVLLENNATFSVTASGTPPLNYQWYFNGSPFRDGGRVGGSTTSNLNITNIQSSDGGLYQLVVTNNYGAATSAVVSLLTEDAQNLSGTVVAWGDNSYGQTNVPSGLTNVIAVAAGYYFSMALKNDGTVTVWGDNSAGETNIPPDLTNVIAIAAGYNHCLALQRNGQVIGWGDNSFGEIGSRFSSNAIAVSGGYYTSYILNSDGTCIGWGNNDFGKVNIPQSLTNAVAIKGGFINAYALTADGDVIDWGYPEVTYIPSSIYGNIIAINGNPGFIALKGDGSIFNGPIGLSNVVAVTAGNPYTFALKNDGTIADWNPTNIQPNLSNVIAIAAGATHGLAIISDGSPKFLKQPFCQTPYPGTSFYFNACAVGMAPLNYQWLRNGTNIPNATNSILNIPNIQTNNNGVYNVAVSNAFGLAVSSNIIINVDCRSPIITSASPNQLGLIGSNLTLNVIATGPMPMTYQWALNGINIAGATDASLTITNFQDANEGNYTVMVSNAYSSTTSGNIYVPANDLPGALDNWSISWDLNTPWFVTTTSTHDGMAAARNPSGLNSSISATVNGPGTLTFWWRVGSFIPDTLTFYIDGVQQSSISGNTSWAQPLFYISGGIHTLTWTFKRASFSSTGAGYLDQVNYMVGPTLTITTPLVDQSVSATGSATFTTTAIGTSPISYQWQFNGTNIDGATNTLFSVSGLQATNAGTYTVIVSNPYLTNSSSAVLTVVPMAPQITSQPSNQRALVNGVANFSVSATGSLPFSYQWQWNGTNLDGATNSSLALTGLQFTNAGNYQVVITNIGGSNTSSVAVLTIARLIAWGYNGLGQTAIPLSLTNAASIAAGANHSLALNFDGTVTAWGNNAFKQLNIPVGLTGVTMIAAGYYHSLALKNDGTVVAWGAGTNDTGQTPHYGQSIVPPNLTNVVAIAGGGYHSLALKSDGTVVAWGAGTNIIGLVKFGQANVPSGLSNVVAVAAGQYHSLALERDGTVVAWGAGTNNTGQAPKFGQSIVPTSLSNVTAIACGQYHNLVLKKDNTVFAWGYNGSGQTNIPPGLTNVVTIACEGNDNLALKNDGNLIVWGDNSFAQTNIPVGLSNVVIIAGGFAHNLAIMNDGSPFVARKSGNQTIYAGTNISLSVSIIGNQPISYFWQCNGTNIDAATNAIFTLTNLPTTSSGIYQCIISNVFGAITSAPINLNVLQTIPRFSSSSLRLDGSGLSLQLNSLSGHGPVIIYASTNLTDWQPVFTNPPLVGSLLFTDPTVTNLPKEFYKAIEQ